MSIRTFAVCLAPLAAAAGLFAQAPTITWEHTFDGVSHYDDWGSSAVLTSTGQTLVAGTTFEEVSPGSYVPQALVMSIAPGGTTSWTRSFGLGFYGGNGSAAKVALAPNGRAVVCGANDVGQDWFVVVYDGAGTELGSDIFDANSWFMSAPSDMELDGSGNAYLCGDFGSGVYGTAGALAKFGPTGQFLWARVFDPATELGSAKGLALGPGGALYVVGATYVAGLAGECSLAKFDSAGNLAWIRHFGGVDPGSDDSAFDVGIDAAGRAVTVGQVMDAALTHTNVLMQAHDAAGNSVWRTEFDAGGNLLSNFIDGVAFDPAGRLAIGGRTFTASFEFDVFAAVVAPGGAVEWTRTYAYPGAYEYVAGVAFDASDNVGVVGTSFSSGSLAFALFFDRQGVSMANAFYGPAGGNSRFYAITAAPSGGFVATGQIAAASVSPDAYTVAFASPAPHTYCTAGTTSHGCVTAISGSGVPSASAGSGFTIAVANVEGVQQGLIFYGVSGPLASPWGSGTGYFCVDQPTERTPVHSAGGNFGACDGVLSVDWNAFIAANPTALGAPFPAGLVVNAQGWFRDPPSPKTTMLSDALEFSVQP